MNNIKDDKKRIRKDIKGIFKKLAPDDYIRKSEAVLIKLETLPEWKEADTVLLFLSLPDEISTANIIAKAISEGKKVAVPRIENNDLCFHYITSADSDFAMHPLGIAEPDPEDPVFNPESADSRTLVLVPGLAFDSSCFRLGRGKGFYDRFLSSLDKSVPKAGIGYDFQVTEYVPVEDHDFSLDMIVTDNSLFRSDRD